MSGKWPPGKLPPGKLFPRNLPTENAPLSLENAPGMITPSLENCPNVISLFSNLQLQELVVNRHSFCCGVGVCIDFNKGPR